jgi:hypothetical protein
MTYKQDRTLEVLEAYLYLKARMVLDSKRNKLFKFLDKHSKRLDAIAEIKIRNFDMGQYAMFRDITQNHYDVREKSFSMFGTPLDKESYRYGSSFTRTK